MKFICPKCGEVEPKCIYYTFPASSNCPICGIGIESDQKINKLSEEKAKDIRP